MCLIRELHKGTALNRLHDQYRFPIPLQHLVNSPALYGRVFIVQIVELDLHDLDLRIIVEDPLQHIGAVMEGNAHMAHLAFRLQRKSSFISTAVFKMVVGPPSLGVHEIKVKVLHAAGVQLLLEERADVLFLLKVVSRQLIGQKVTIPGIAAGQPGAESRLAPAAQIAVGRVEIIETGVQKRIHHLRKLFLVNLLPDQGQPHAAKAEISVDLREKAIVFHMVPPLYVLGLIFSSIRFRRSSASCSVSSFLAK